MRAKKSLGQNFLKSKAALGAILRAADLNAGDTVLEIGPGKGVLTEGLLDSVGKDGKVVAVEKDHRMVGFLQEKFAEDIKTGKLTLIHDDILSLETRDLIQRSTQYTLVANIPYYITGQIFRKFLQSEDQPSKIVLMVQKEVAKRIIAADNKESILSISVKVFGTPKYIQTVPARYFSPAPKVDSAILLIKQIHNPFLSGIDPAAGSEKFFSIVQKGFSSKRKLLKNNLSCDDEIMRKCEIDTKARAENLTVENWLCILKYLV
ncbi:16S rRNA (adenine(1518)-N(6)/adenine(1519)-N(6))-dimethyltransferase RsmA [Patescibacteria group bacterium]